MQLNTQTHQQLRTVSTRAVFTDRTENLTANYK